MRRWAFIGGYRRPGLPEAMSATRVGSPASTHRSLNPFPNEARDVNGFLVDADRHVSGHANSLSGDCRPLLRRDFLRRPDPAGPPVLFAVGKLQGAMKSKPVAPEREPVTAEDGAGP